MTATSDLDILLQNKKPVPLFAKFQMVVKFGLWKDYSHWLEPEQWDQYACQLEPTHASDFWNTVRFSKYANVKLIVKINNKVVAQATFSELETQTLNFELPDDIETMRQLGIEIINLGFIDGSGGNGSFVAPMISIESFTLQGVDIKNILNVTAFGQDGSSGFGFNTPVYPWMVEKRKVILPKIF